MQLHAVPTVCIVGRTNVGKSTLFNALVGRRTAVVKDVPGVTRDRAYETVDRFGFPFKLIDTGALVGEEEIPLYEAVYKQTEVAIQESDVLIVVFDGLHGLHPRDQDVMDLVRRYKKPVIWVANKCEKESAQQTATELYGLGIEELIMISAAHRRGVRDLIASIKAKLLEQGKLQTEEEAFANSLDPESTEVPENFEPIKIAVLGKPNVGKSTLVNRLLGEDRMITSPIAGTTRDSVSAKLTRNGRNFVIVDTAGLRKKAGVKEKTIERFSNIRTLKSLAQCDVAVFVMDASDGIPTEQDAKIVGLAHDKGKSLLIIVNKWDLIEKEPKTAEAYRQGIKSVFKFAQYAPIIFVSALTGQRCLTILDEAAEAFKRSKQRIKTSELNKILSDAFTRRPPPVYRGAPVKLMYATQVAVQPPTFSLFVNYPERLNFAYERYLKNSIRAAHPFEGVDIRIIFRRRSQLDGDVKRT